MNGLSIPAYEQRDEGTDPGSCEPCGHLGEVLAHRTRTKVVVILPMDQSCSRWIRCPRSCRSGSTACRPNPSATTVHAQVPKTSLGAHR
jgi:hypothetical protein